MGKDPETWVVPIAVAWLAAGGFKTMIEIFRDWRSQAGSKRRAEVDRLAETLREERDARKIAEAAAREALAALRVAERHERIATEWGHENRVAAIKAGGDLPPDLDFKDD